MRSTLLLVLSLTLAPTPAFGDHNDFGDADACREAQRAVQVALGDPGTAAPAAASHTHGKRHESHGRHDARRHHRVVEALDVLREYGGSHDVDRRCVACIIREFAHDVPVAEQSPCGTHDVCVAGWRLQGDEDCAARVCERRPFCCFGWWTERCARAAERTCGISCDACEHDACVEGVILHRGCGDCAEQICDTDPYCCDTTWDARCVEQAQNACGQTCAVPVTSTTTSTTTTTTTSTTSTSTSTTTSTLPLLPRLGCATVADCDDGNVCTNDFCESDGSCTHRNNRVACEDGNLCTLDDQCAFGTCRGGPRMAPVNECTFDWCHTSGECRHRIISCNDANRCTVDTCDPTVGCSNDPIHCDDGDSCTIDSCHSSLGCVSTPDPICTAP